MTDIRAIAEPQWPAGGFSFNRMDDRNWDVQQFTGYPVSTVGEGRWVRGQIVRRFSPQFRPPMLGYFAYDPTDPATWHQPQV